MAGLTLTELDKAALSQIGKEGFQSYVELRRSVFAKCSRSHVWKRLKKLCNSGFLTKIVDHKQETLGWILDKDAVPTICKLIPGIKINNGHAPSYTTGYKHDLFLREIKRDFERYQELTGWITEAEIRKQLGERQGRMGSHLVPDAKIRVQHGDDSLVGNFELELTRKTKKKVQAKIETYLLSSNIDFILYAVSTPELGRFIAEQLWEVRENSLKVKLHRQRIPVIIVSALELKNKSMELLFERLEKVQAPIGASQAA